MMKNIIFTTLIIFLLSGIYVSKQALSKDVKTDEMKKAQKIIKCLGLKDGDIPVKIMGHALNSENMEKITKELSSTRKSASSQSSSNRSNKKLNLTVIRNGKEKKIALTLNKNCKI